MYRHILNYQITRNSFKHGVKEHFFKRLKNKEQDIFAH